jgi:crossover junction endodeoxyribonuclease RuvC
MIRILGIDPGSRNAGFGVVEIHRQEIKYCDSGILTYESKLNFLDRLHQIFESCQKLIEIYRPEEIALESLILVKNVSSLSKLAQTRGAMVVAFSKNYLGKVFEYSPTLIKSSLVGYGHCDKEGIKKGLGLIFGQKNFKSSDQSDALAVAVCHALMKTQRSLTLLR